jgi:hypothetical protein
MKNVEELRIQLASVFMGLRDGSVKHTDAAELANLAGKMINSAKGQIEYYALRKETPYIPFLESSANEFESNLNDMALPFIPEPEGQGQPSPKV